MRDYKIEPGVALSSPPSGYLYVPSHIQKHQPKTKRYVSERGAQHRKSLQTPDNDVFSELRRHVVSSLERYNWYDIHRIISDEE